MELSHITRAGLRHLPLAVAVLGLAVAALLLSAGGAKAAYDGFGADGEAGGIQMQASDLEPKPPRSEERAHRQQRSGGQKRLAEVHNSAGEILDVTDDACRRNLAVAAAQGLTLPEGWKLHCVGPGLDWNGGSHWGVTCPYQECPEGEGPYVSISNPTYYVVAHELCHANFGNDELMADDCAAEHGASLATSPYS